MRNISRIMVLLPFLLYVNSVFASNERGIVYDRLNAEYQFSLGECSVGASLGAQPLDVQSPGFEREEETAPIPLHLHCMGVISVLWDTIPCASTVQGFACARFFRDLNLLVSVTLTLSEEKEERTYVGDTAYGQGHIRLVTNQCDELPNLLDVEPKMHLSQCESTLRLVDETKHCFYRREGQYCVVLDDRQRVFKETWFFY